MIIVENNSSKEEAATRKDIQAELTKQNAKLALENQNLQYRCSSIAQQLVESREAFTKLRKECQNLSGCLGELGVGFSKEGGVDCEDSAWQFLKAKNWGIKDIIRQYGLALETHGVHEEKIHHLVQQNENFITNNQALSKVKVELER